MSFDATLDAPNRHADVAKTAIKYFMLSPFMIYGVVIIRHLRRFTIKLKLIFNFNEIDTFPSGSKDA